MQGIYKITNTENGQVYIGRSTDIEKRWAEHQKALENGTHHSYKLQQCYNNLDDKNKLKYEVIELVKREIDLPDREQYYYDEYDSYNNGYNCCPYADNPKYKKHCFIFYGIWHEYLCILEEKYGRNYANSILMELIHYGVHGPERVNDTTIFGKVYPPFNDWLKENNRTVEKVTYNNLNPTK